MTSCQTTAPSPSISVPRPPALPEENPCLSPPSLQMSPNAPSVPPPANFTVHGGAVGTRTVAEAYADAHSHPANCNTFHANFEGGILINNSKEKEKKPIFDWITRKLNARRATVSEGPHRAKQPRSRLASMPKARGLGLSNGNGNNANGRPDNRLPPIGRADTFRSVSFSVSSAANTFERDRRREANNPYPSLPLGPAGRHKQLMDESAIQSGTIGTSASGDGHSREGSGRIWSRRSSRSKSIEGGEGEDSRADDDASLRPFPPSVRASPTQSSFRSRSASMLYPNTALQRPQTTFSTSSGTGHEEASENGSAGDDEDDEERRREGSISTKLTTCISFDSSSGVAHIAQAPLQRHSSSELSSPQHEASAVLHANAGTLTPPISPIIPDASATAPVVAPSSIRNLVQAPKHSKPHPCYNPRPSSPPERNASTLTLASSTFAIASPGQIHRPPSLITSPSFVAWAGPSTPSSPPNLVDRDREYPGSTYTSHSYTHSYGGGHLSIGAPSVSLSVRGIRSSGVDGRADKDASVKAVRRKGSWESYESGWSWRGAGTGPPASGSIMSTHQVPGATLAAEKGNLTEGKDMGKIPDKPLVIAIN
ncbi:uncharacterized protein L203_100451 [Cryptococcus depauperatus CBS 7841]|uniref:Uncharacterized protein n=1 Tax=Cryptococcus depauperatus CBS 7841 TaxID=1295531 RepID=A0A1E3HPJ2_9TREE|nr:hypothetical protein L203_06302 [Cryptococcus depauperatus CBS 7841]